ncbi:MAG: phosphotransferase, partial [Actinomycetota bacterium]
MFTAPSDLPDDAVADAFGRGWGVAVDAIEYAPVGFGSHHWRAVGSSGRWFLTVDDLDLRLAHPSDSRSTARGRLVAALSTAVSLRSRGCDFVVAPVPSRAGAVIESIGDHYVLAAYPHVEG